MSNLLLQTDVYKFAHKDQYPTGLTKVYSYLESRGTREQGLDFTVFFGLQYYIEKYLRCPTHTDVAEFVEVADSILGKGAVSPAQMYALADLGYLPLEIKAVPEGTVVYPLGNVLMTITNTHPDFGWLVNFMETLLMKIWMPITVASNSLRFRRLFEMHAEATCDNMQHVPFQMHDFGYRGVSSEESGAIGGAAHLLSFLGTDTTAGVVMLRDYYAAQPPIGLSVPASEHSVMCAWSDKNDDFPAIENMLKQYPTGIVSIVSDTYDLWNAVIAGYAGEFRELVTQRDGKTVIRPDSGDPVKIVCGDPDAPNGSPEQAGMITLLDFLFGSTVNQKGFKELNPKVGCIYGDAIYYDRADEILTRLAQKGYAANNIVFGSGGLLLNNWSRDTLKMAIKATYCEIDGVPRDIEKKPKTDLGKISKKGKLKLVKVSAGYTTVPEDAEGTDVLRTVFKDGWYLKDTLTQIRERLQ